MRIYDLPQDVMTTPPLCSTPGDDHRQQPACSSSGSGCSSPDSLAVVLRMDEGETVYDYCWYPRMLITDPASAVFVTSSRVGGTLNPKLSPPLNPNPWSQPQLSP